jgi:hypothetical protein
LGDIDLGSFDQEGNGDMADLDLWVDSSYATRSMGEIRSGAQAVFGMSL